MQHLLVSAGVVKDSSGRLLICRRSGALSGLWEFPGGKCEPGETPAECLARELDEELELKVLVGEELTRIIQCDASREIELVFLEASVPDGTALVLHVHEAAEWTAPEHLSNYPFCPGDARFVKWLQMKTDSNDSMI